MTWQDDYIKKEKEFWGPASDTRKIQYGLESLHLMMDKIKHLLEEK